MRKVSGRVFGPVSLDTLRAWACDGRVAPVDEVCEGDGPWRQAGNVPDLGMEWLIELPGGELYGPVPLAAFLDMLREGSLGPDLKVRRRDDAGFRRLGDVAAEGEPKPEPAVARAQEPEPAPQPGPEPVSTQETAAVPASSDMAPPAPAPVMEPSSPIPVDRFGAPAPPIEPEASPESDSPSTACTGVTAAPGPSSLRPEVPDREPEVSVPAVPQGMDHAPVVGMEVTPAPPAPASPPALEFSVPFEGQLAREISVPPGFGADGAAAVLDASSAVPQDSAPDAAVEPEAPTKSSPPSSRISPPDEARMLSELQSALGVGRRFRVFDRLRPGRSG